MNSQFSPRSACPLVGTLADPRGNRPTGDGDYRRYRSAVRFGIPIDGSPTYKVRSIFYEVGRRFTRAADILARNPDVAMPIDCSVAINPAEAANFEGVARQHSNFSPQWEMMDLSGIAERLARAVSACSLYNDVSTTTMRGTNPIRVVALNTLHSPQTASSTSVFIPRTVDSVGCDNIFAVLCAAANGCGASVTTDVLRLDSNTNQPIVPSVQGSTMAGACVEALRIVGANMEASGAGDVFAYAVTRGIHFGLSVVGHTDEGGFLRGVLRSDAFRVPYGGINQGLNHYPALPALASSSVANIGAWVDAIALKTAAAVAHCDPLVTGLGGLYPSVFVSSGGGYSPPGSDAQAGTDADARSIGRGIASDVSRFAPLYMRALTSLFGLLSVSGVAEAHLCTVAGRYLSSTPDRHLKYKTVAPYFWIEPTSLLATNQFGTPAELAGYASRATAGQVRSEACFERLKNVPGLSNANHSTVAFKMRTARTSPLVCALAGDPSSLSPIHLYQFDTDSVCLPGDQLPTLGTVADKHAAADPLCSYLWVRGQSCFPAPAEFMNTNAMYGAKTKHFDWDDDFNTETTSFPSLEELIAGEVTTLVSVPTGLPNGPSNAGDRQAKRARCRAAMALQQSVVRSRAFGEAMCASMEVSNVPPTFDDLPTIRSEHEATPLEDPGQAREPGEGNALMAAQEARGPPAPPVALMGPQTAPQLRQVQVNAPGQPQPRPANAPPPPHLRAPEPAPSAAGVAAATIAIPPANETAGQQVPAPQI